MNRKMKLAMIGLVVISLLGGVVLGSWLFSRVTNMHVNVATVGQISLWSDSACTVAFPVEFNWADMVANGSQFKTIYITWDSGNTPNCYLTWDATGFMAYWSNFYVTKTTVTDSDFALTVKVGAVQWLPISHGNMKIAMTAKGAVGAVAVDLALYTGANPTGGMFSFSLTFYGQDT